GLDQTLLRDFRTKVAAIRQPIGADDRESNVMPHVGFGFGREQILPRGLEELHDRDVFERRRVRHVDDDLRAGERLGQTSTGDRVDAGIRRGCEHFLPALTKKGYELRADEARATDHYDFHVLTPRGDSGALKRARLAPGVLDGTGGRLNRRATAR